VKQQMFCFRKEVATVFIGIALYAYGANDEIQFAVQAC
jgi:hypothetical protein